MNDEPRPSLPRRPASWLGEAELRRRAHRRNVIYLLIAAGCLLLFVLLIHLLLDRTRWSAGPSPQGKVTILR